MTGATTQVTSSNASTGTLDRDLSPAMKQAAEVEHIAMCLASEMVSSSISTTTAAAVL